MMKLPLYKIVMVGDTCVGKSSILRRYIDHIYIDTNPNTIGVDFRVTQIELDKERTVKIQIWDTAGQERFHCVTSAYYRGADGILLIYDITDEETFTNVPYHLAKIRERAHAGTPILLVGNKCDSTSRRVSLADAQEYALANGLMHIETSVLTGHNVEECFISLTKKMVERRDDTQHKLHNSRQFKPELPASSMKISIDSSLIPPPTILVREPRRSTYSCF